ncbi:MAG TPA: hypothetical protein GX702_13425 [Chloroflexi bacterium]|jgi:hypothetical protein|nr:hypothetical protein [Chloroflexota bacterium]
MLRILGILAVVAIIASAVFASAAGLTVQGGSIQAGVDGALWCDPDGVRVTGWGLETDDSTVYSVTIGDINSACVGNKIHVRLQDANGNWLGNKVTGEVTGSTFKASFNNPRPSAAAIEKLLVWIDGPNP